MRLILLDPSSPKRFHFDPLALCRPIFELRVGMTTLAQKCVDKLHPTGVACFVPPYLADAYREQTDWPVNDTGVLAGDDLLIVNARVNAAHFDLPPTGPSQAAFDADGDCLYARIAEGDIARLENDSIDGFLASAKKTLPTAPSEVATWNYTWDLVLENSECLLADFAAAGRQGVEGNVEQPSLIRGNDREVYVAPGAVVHPMVVIDAENGPVYIDRGAQIHPFTRIEGPCYIGEGSILLGAKCRQGNSLGANCRVGGEIEASILQGYANKYHDGFLGHAYLGEWVNLGAMTTNSDLKNDYSNVSVVLDGRKPIDTGSRKVGSLIGDHTKTAIGTLLNTGAYVGAMGVIAGTGRPLPKFIPDFAWFTDGTVTEGFGKQRQYEAAKIVMRRRGRRWTAAQEAMWDEIYRITAPARDDAIQRARRDR
jgi:UDP-N-acetylglucosamine diphosphorylase/glucosamine-1-phosphate N-acetyltransferase